MPAFSRILIVGAGLIGGSIGKAARERGIANEVVGLVRSEGSAERARRADVADTVTMDAAQASAGAELVVICTPVGTVVESLRTLLPHLPEGVVVTDVGSTKARIVRQAAGLLKQESSSVDFVGSHPLAGDHRTGPEAARGDLFHERLVVVTRDESTDAAACEKVQGAWQQLGARTEVMAPDTHDRLVAGSSHVPHLVASVLAAATPPEALPLTAGGWRDTTRIAAGDPDLWLDILRDNRAEVLAVAKGFGDSLQQVVGAIDSSDWHTVRKFLADGKHKHDLVDGLPADTPNQDE